MKYKNILIIYIIVSIIVAFVFSCFFWNLNQRQNMLQTISIKQTNLIATNVLFLSTIIKDHKIIKPSQKFQLEEIEY